MNQENVTIKCENCGEPVNINNALTHQLEKQISQKFQNKLDKEKQQIQRLKDELETDKEKINETINSGINKKLKIEKEKLETQITSKLNDENSEKIRIMEKELNEKSEKVKELNKSKAEIEKLKREKSELKDEIEADAEQKLNEQIRDAKIKIHQVEKEKNDAKLKEVQIKLDDQKKLTEEMQRKQNQGSMEMQGEIGEKAIEEWLASQFPLDVIEEIKKGARGGDCIQNINTPTQQKCGIIYYESKRTKVFQPAWIDKFKNDMREKNASIGVIVTQTMPTDLKRMGQQKGIWICSFEEFKGLSQVLRESIIQLNRVIISQKGKGDKMELLYNFLSGSEFRLQIEGIVDGFTEMKIDLDKEKRAMQKLWKQREKQIDKVITNTIDMHSSIKGIAGNAIQAVQQLELGD
ncbi:MAG: DUF2130 domain-containing protein [Candidatus Marinimicrobia bacterium]|nr:DUF2130 domain-containing protein [Candidatus Neomarinimicrobiota bacterium]